MAAVLFASIAASAIDNRLVLPEPVWTLGLALFVYTVGLASGPGFVAALRRRGLAANALVLAELDFMAGRRLGAAATAAVRSDVAAGAYGVEWWPGAARATAAVAERWAGIALGLTDASLVALAAHAGTTRIATLDERHFRAVRPLGAGDGAFTLLPLDC